MKRPNIGYISYAPIYVITPMMLIVICHNEHHILYMLQWLKPQNLLHTCVMNHDLLCEKNHILI
jgi:hypothetical protein